MSTSTGAKKALTLTTEQYQKAGANRSGSKHQDEGMRIVWSYSKAEAEFARKYMEQSVTWQVKQKGVADVCTAWAHRFSGRYIHSGL